jgi:hypothetical protein
MSEKGFNRLFSQYLHRNNIIPILAPADYYATTAPGSPKDPVFYYDAAPPAYMAKNYTKPSVNGSSAASGYHRIKTPSYMENESIQTLLSLPNLAPRTKKAEIKKAFACDFPKWYVWCDYSL